MTMPSDPNTPLEEILLARVPADGRAVGNTTLIRDLTREHQWSSDQYWEVRDRLIERGVLEKGRGKGGSVSRILKQEATPPRKGVEKDKAKSANAAEYAAERDLYDPMAKVLGNEWAKDSSFHLWRVEITGLQGKRDTGGKWSRPDITVATITVFPFLPDKVFDIITFEIKRAEALDVTLVYEALAHLRASNRAYCLVHLPEEKREGLSETVDEVCAEARRHGVGVITAAEPTNYETWEILVESARRTPDPGRLNEFIRSQLSQQTRDEIIKWFK